MIKYIGIYVFSVFISSVSQIFLKISARKGHKNFISEYLNGWVICAYFIFFCSTLLTIFAYQVVPLSLGPIIESLGYIFVSLLGYLFLHEKLGKQKTIGLICILLGIVIANL